MKHFIIIVFCSVFFFFLIAPTASSQDCKLCGEWKGAVWDRYAHNTKISAQEARSTAELDVRRGRITCYLSVNKYGDEYKIKKKYYYDDTGETRYDDDYVIEILGTTDTSICYKAVYQGFSYDYDDYYNPNCFIRMSMTF